MVDMWVKCRLWVNQPGQLSLPSFRGVAIHVITWITRLKTIKQQTRAVCGCLVARLQARMCGLSLQPIGCKPALSVTQSANAAAVCGLWHYISVGPLPFFYLLLLCDFIIRVMTIMETPDSTISPNSTIPLGPSCHDTTHYLAHAFWHRKKSWRAVARVGQQGATHTTRLSCASWCNGPSGIWAIVGPINRDALQLLSELGSRRLVETTWDVRASSFLLLKISVVVQRFNSVSPHNGFIKVGRIAKQFVYLSVIFRATKGFSPSNIIISRRKIITTCYTTPCWPLTARIDDLYPILYYLNF